MKSNLTKVSVALLSAVVILGCQDQGSGPVGPDVAPQFDKAAKGEHNHGDGGGPEQATVGLSGGMATDIGIPLQVSGTNDDLKVGLSVIESTEAITMNFAPNCTDLVGVGGRHGVPLSDDNVVRTYLKAQLEERLPSEFFFMLRVDKTGLTAEDGSSTTSDGHTIKVAHYGDELDGFILSKTEIALGRTSGVGDATVEWTSSIAGVDVFKFTGPIVVSVSGVGGNKGKKGRRAIACGGADDNLVTATGTRP